MTNRLSKNSEKLNIKLLDRQKDVKIRFLQDQNTNLRINIKDLEENLKLNKESLLLLLKKENFGVLNSLDSKTNPQQKYMSHQASNLEETNDTNNVVRSLHKVIEKLTKENQNHMENIKKLIKERNHAQTRAFVNELISDEAQKNENDIVGELRDRILFLQALVNQKEKNENFQTEKKSEDVIICKALIEHPEEQVIKLHKDFFAVKNALAVLFRKYSRLKTEQKDLNLFAELSKFKEKKMINRAKENKTSDDTDHGYENASVITYYKEFMKETGEQTYDDLELSPLNSPFPQKISVNKNQASASKQSTIPKLDLTKAKKIQETNARRVVPPKNINPNALNKSVESGIQLADQTEKIKKLENEILRVKRLLQVEIVNHNRMAEELENALKERMEIVEKLEILKSSQREYEKKWEKIFHYLTFYREFYFKSIFQLYKDKINQETFDNFENDLNQLIGLDTVQNRINEEKTGKPLNLREIAIKEIENQFSQRKPQDNDKNCLYVKESNRSCNNTKSFSICDTNLQNETPHINNLPDGAFNKGMKFVNNPKREILKRRISKSQVFDYNMALKKAGKEKKIKNRRSLSQTSDEFDYGKKINQGIEKRLISPLSKSINQENDFCFLSKNNFEFKRKNNSNNLMINEELFI